MIDELMHGTKKPLHFIFESHFSGEKEYAGHFEGILNNLNRRYRESTSDRAMERIEAFLSDIPCPDCHGARLKMESLVFKLGGKNIYESTLLSVVDAMKFSILWRLATWTETSPIRF